jgi:hypothetical protein
MSYYEENREKIISNVKARAEKNKDRIKAYQAIYRKEHDKENKEYQAKYRAMHIEKSREYSKSYQRERLKNDEAFRISRNIRARIRNAIHNNAKSKSSFELLGCTVDELKVHMEAQFKEGMTWANWGRFGWHMDHIIPCASFDLSDPEQQKACFHYTNLQPLWYWENQLKGKKILLP